MCGPAFLRAWVPLCGAIGLAILLMPMAGCGRGGYGELGLIEVSGTVTLDGQPLPGAKVMFEGEDKRAAIGITEQEEGMPLGGDAPEAPAIAALSLDALRDMLAKARARTRDVAATLDDADLDRRVVRRRPNGAERVFDVAWVLHHLIEHEAGHRSQIALLRHLYRATRAS